MFDSLIQRIRTEPALVLSVVAAIVLAVLEEDPTTWGAVVSIALGVIVRQLVTPTPIARKNEQDAFFDGLDAGRENR